MFRCLAICLLYLLLNAPLLAQNNGFTFILLNKKTNAAQLSKEESDKLMQGHMANINRLAQEKKLVSAGPFDGGGGMFIFNTSSVQTATEWLGTDPAVKANRWDVEIYPYSPRVGSVCLVQEPYQMVTYSFVRFKVDITKSTVNSAGIFFSHDEYLKELKGKLNVIAEGTFGDRDGGVLILKDEPSVQLLEADPGVQQGMLELDLRKLWIAKGAFCEN
ncbi:YciI family protein [Chryseolinea sp. T2]|uniref:YciI family protein n=1 Tax=Chryseolinea sp. T2 TaxID=3129255 RepID=UPI0030785B33